MYYTVYTIFQANLYAPLDYTVMFTVSLSVHMCVHLSQVTACS